jgi:hypothetical protein
MSSPTIFIIPALILSVIFILPASAAMIPLTSQHDTIVKGDTVTLIGSGATNGTIAIWVIGRDYFAVKTVQPDKMGNFTVVIKPAETRTYSSGQYAFLIQDPGSNHAIEIEPLIWDEGIKIAILGKIVADIGKKEDIPSFISQKVDIITNSTSLPNVDDIITPYFFYVEGPGINFDGLTGSGAQSKLPNQTTGERVEISGTTNMGVENQLHVEIRNLSSRALITSGNIPVYKGIEQNQWSYVLEAPGLPEGDYYVVVGRSNGIDAETGTALLNVIGQSPSSAQNHKDISGLTQDYTALFPIFISIGALGVIAVIIIASMKTE